MFVCHFDEWSMQMMSGAKFSSSWESPELLYSLMMACNVFNCRYPGRFCIYHQCFRCDPATVGQGAAGSPYGILTFTKFWLSVFLVSGLLNVRYWSLVEQMNKNGKRGSCICWMTYSVVWSCGPLGTLPAFLGAFIHLDFGYSHDSECIHHFWTSIFQVITVERSFPFVPAGKLVWSYLVKDSAEGAGGSWRELRLLEASGMLSCL